MTVNTKLMIAAGFARVDFHVLDSAGIAAGPTGSITSGAAGSAAGRILGAQSAETGVAEALTVNISGDDGNLGAFVFGPAEINAFNLDVGAHNLTNDATFQSTSVEDQGDISIGVLDPGLPTYVDVSLLLVSRAKAKQSGSDGVANYTGLIIPKCNIVPQGRITFQGREGGGFRYRVQPTRTDTLPYGKTLTDSTNGTQNGVYFPWSAENPITIHRWTGTGAVTDFTLGETPASTAVSKMRVFINTTLTTAVSVVVATKTLTISPAPANGAKIVAMYEYTT